MTDAEVKAKLSIEQDGDSKGFRDAADAVEALATSAGGAAPSLESLKTAAESLEATLKGVAAGLQAIEAAGATTFAPLLAQLDQVIAKADTAAAALAHLTGPT
jgi:hypothetical protein